MRDLIYKFRNHTLKFFNPSFYLTHYAQKNQSIPALRQITKATVKYGLKFRIIQNLLILVFLICGNLRYNNLLLCYEIDEEKFLTQYFWQEVTTLLPPKRPKIALVLSGGGARGLAHIGVIKVLEEENVPIDVITGTSVGALVSALYASGIPISKIESLAEEIGWVDITNISAPSVIGLVLADKLLSTEKMEKYITDKIGNKQFHELKIPFACAAVDIKTGEKIIFKEGDVSLATRASATIPGIFLPVEFRHRLLVDGGIVDNVPTDLAKMLGADIILCVNVESDFTKNEPPNVLLVLNQAISIQSKLLSTEHIKQSDFVIKPELKDIAIYELWKSKECISSGIIACRKSINEIKKLLMDTTYKWLLKK